MKNFILALAAAGMMALSGAGVAQAQDGDIASKGDVKKGERVWRKCRTCHNLDKAQNKVGPHLVKVINRPIASIDGFKYSNGMTKFGEENAAWTQELMFTYLEKPRKLVKGTRMAFNGLRKEKDRVNLIAYLVEKGGVTKAEEAATN
ncbi:MAG: cytochrome c family protein [Pseudomonadota bacterium]